MAVLMTIIQGVFTIHLSFTVLGTRVTAKSAEV